MADLGPGTDRIVQVALVVRDIEEAVRHWARVFGQEPPPIRESMPAAGTGIRYRGEPTEGRAKLAFFIFGQVAVELIEPVGGPSTWRDHLERHGPGLHHIAFQVPDLDHTVAQLEGEDLHVVQAARFRSGRYAYVDAQDTLGTVLELLEITPQP